MTMKNKGQFGIMAIITLMVLVIVGAVVVLPVVSDIITVQGDSNTYLGIGSTFNANFTANTTLQPDVRAGTDVVTCPDVEMIRDTDYTIYNTAGKLFLKNNSNTQINGSFISLVGVNVSLWTANNEFASIATISVFNCTDYAKVWAANNNYTLYSNYAFIKINATGSMLNNTKYCYNATGSRTYSGAACTIQYEFNTGVNTGQITGTTGTIVDLFPLIIAIVILIAIVGYVGFRK